ncbi:hypothetical protein NsoK4_07370 [Nitrosopumilus sp. K4]|uniref:hypothetical protein n=1 Tax=Nitrosopumilus sp. K4 TaxID=2795383 RepID=UPI001BA8B81C|nr:hypothetical protein [Nitrosopumilus sp. K4]QUC64251.1 hypothetical protein NsoK4_07370 [Nitrosopumilus sp. K4]
MEKNHHIAFFAEKVYFHHWPPESPKWTESRKEKIEKDINLKKEDKKIIISAKLVQIDNYVFDSVKKIGLTIPQFKRQSTMIFEGHCEDFDAHVHVTTRSEDYLEIFYKLMKWRDEYFPDTPFLDSKN